MTDETVNRKQFVKSGTLGAGMVLVAVLVLMVNYFGWKYHKRFDWTGSELYSLSEKSRNVLEGLDRDIEAVMFITPASPLYDPVRELLARYEAESPRISVSVIDPERNPAQAQALVDKYEVSSLSSVVLDLGDDRRVLEEADFADYDYSGMQYGQGPQMQEFKGEQLITGAIVELLEGEKPKILFTAGHGEAAIDDFSARGLSQARDLLGQDNFEMEKWEPLGQPAVPEGTDLVVIAGPRVEFLAQELEVFKAYLEQGGRILLMVDPPLAELGIKDAGLAQWLAEYGVRLGEDLVLDRDNHLPLFSPETFFANSWGGHAVTEALDQAGFPVIFAVARSVGRQPDVTGAEVTELVRTGRNSWAETDLVNLEQVKEDDADLKGPVSLAVAVEIETLGARDGAEAPETGEEASEEEPAGEEPAEAGDEVEGTGEAAKPAPARLVVFGDSDFATNAQLSAVGNPVLLLNAMNWLVERDKLLGIPPKEAEQVRLNLTRGEISSITWLALLVLPGFGVLLGLAVHFRRRR